MGYDGYHKWNFANLDGRLTLHAANMSDVDVHTALGTALVQSIRCNSESVKLGRSKPGVLLCHIQKGHEACDEHDRILDQILQTDKARRPIFHRSLTILHRFLLLLPLLRIHILLPIHRKQEQESKWKNLYQYGKQTSGVLFLPITKTFSIKNAWFEQNEKL